MVTGFFNQPGNCPATLNIVTATTPDTSVTATACVEVQPQCFIPGINILPDQTELKNIGSVFNNSTFYVAGVLIIENMGATFTNCTLYTAAGANIIVNNATITLNNSYIIACDTMWQGFTMMADAWIQAR
nr:hypothetical protein [Bacteroidota bacterium]